MKDMWVCGDCRAVNHGKARRCYSCQVLRSSGEMSQAAAAMSSASAARGLTVMAWAARSGARYRPTWPIAILVVPAMILATALDIAQVQASSAVAGSAGRILPGAVQVDLLTSSTLAQAAAYTAAFLLWSIWIALVVGVPALTGRWPPHGIISAFFAAWIPFIQLKRPHSIVRGVLAILAEGRAGPGLIALAWWVTILASYFVPVIVLFSYARGAGPGTQSTLALALQVRLFLLMPALILAIAVVVIVEREQLGALRRRATTVLAGGGPRP